MKAKLKTLTPVHVGNGTTYNRNIDYFQFGNEIGIIDEEKILDIIGPENIHQWVSAIERGNRSVVNLLISRGWRENDLPAVSKRTCRLLSPGNNSTQLKEQYRTSLEGVCLPGSGLKGAIRTAIFNYMADEKFIKSLNIGDLKSTNGPFNSGIVEKKLFGDTANEKSTRFIKIRDAHFGNVKTDVHEIRILNAYRDSWSFKKGEQILVESIPAGAETQFDFIMDLTLLQRNIDKNGAAWPASKISFLSGGINNLCQIINNFTRSQIRTDFDDLYDETLDDGEEILNGYHSLLEECKSCTANEFVIRTGGHSGYLFTTGRWIDDANLDITDDEFYSLRKLIQKRDYRDMYIWPKTRKISSEGQLFGFIKVTLF